MGRDTQLLMLGGTIDAAHAERIGLISELVAEDELDQAVDRLARRLATGPAHAHAQTKALLMTGKDYAEFHAALTEGRDPLRPGRGAH